MYKLSQAKAQVLLGCHCYQRVKQQLENINILLHFLVDLNILQLTIPVTYWSWLLSNSSVSLLAQYSTSRYLDSLDQVWLGTT